MNKKEQQVIDIFCDLERLAEQGGILVDQMMTTSLITGRPETSVAEIIKILYSNPFHHLPIVNKYNKLEGIVSDRDLVRCFCRNTKNMAEGIFEIQASTIMSTDLITVRSYTELNVAIQLMKTRGISCLPVLDEDQTLMGIITDSDLWELLQMTLETMKKPEILQAISQAITEAVRVASLNGV